MRALALVLLAACAARDPLLAVPTALERHAALAAPPPADHAPWTLEQVLARALAVSPGRAAVEARVEEAAGEALAARAVDGPQVRVGVDDVDARDDTWDWEVDLRADLPHPAQGAEVRAARAAVVASARDAAAEVARLRGEVGALFHAVRLGDALLAAHAGVIAAEEEALALAVARRAAGLGDDLDVLEAEADLARAKARAATAARVLRGDRARLAAHLGVAPSALPTLAPAEAPPLPITEGAAVEAALARRPELDAARARLAAAASTRRAAALAPIPWFDWVQLGFDLPGGLGAPIPGTPARPALRGELAVRLPLWSPGTGELRRARAEEARRRAELDGAVLLVADEVREAWAAWEEADAARRAVQAVAARAAALSSTPSPDPVRAQRLRARQAALAVDGAEAERAWWVAASRLAAVGGEGP